MSVFLTHICNIFSSIILVHETVSLALCWSNLSGTSRAQHTKYKQFLKWNRKHILYYRYVCCVHVTSVFQTHFVTSKLSTDLMFCSFTHFALSNAMNLIFIFFFLFFHKNYKEGKIVFRLIESRKKQKIRDRKFPQSLILIIFVVFVAVFHFSLLLSDLLTTYLFLIFSIQFLFICKTFVRLIDPSCACWRRW